MTPPRAMGLAPLAVLRGHERHRLGSLGADFAVVLGHPRYYSRFGFRPASGFGLDSDYNAGDAFMALELRSGALAGVRGRVRYAAEFAGV